MKALFYIVFTFQLLAAEDDLLSHFRGRIPVGLHSFVFGGDFNTRTQMYC